MNLIFWLDVWLLSTILGAVLFRIWTLKEIEDESGSWHAPDVYFDLPFKVITTCSALCTFTVSVSVAHQNARMILFTYSGITLGGICGCSWVWFLKQKELRAKAQALVDAHLEKARAKLDAELDAQARKMRGR